ncbi:MAG: UDP-glucose/GDP-mannose dehydrogenase family protein [Burkholderiales bacterium]|nr:UDP-glucose/GDP-mannose dehydrogenase family protein [Burkholderiales bacterium]
MTQPVIGFAGMTHLGLVSGISASEKGFDVVCFDGDTARIEPIRQGRLPVSEPQLGDLFTKNAARLSFTADPAGLARCDVIYVAPDVPTDDQGASDIRPIEAMLDAVFAAARPDATVVLLSQIPPGFTRMRQRTGRTLYCQVETLIFGRAVERALFPERYIIGCADPAQPLPAPYAQFLAAHNCPLLPMRYESAELAKISINMFLVASVSTTNTLAEVCENVGADWSEIAPALRLDRRIGPWAYLGPGLGIAGGNLERDLATICQLADRHHTDAGVVRSWIANSRHRAGWAARTIRTLLLDAAPKAAVAVWGLAYKENTHSVKNSPSLATLAALPGASLRVYDPVVQASAANHDSAVGAGSALEALAGTQALMILTPWPQFKEISPADIASAMAGRLVLDPYKVLDPAAAKAAGLDVRTLGRGAANA